MSNCYSSSKFSLTYFINTWVLALACMWNNRHLIIDIIFAHMFYDNRAFLNNIIKIGSTITNNINTIIDQLHQLRDIAHNW